MKRLLVSVGVLVGIVLVPIVVYALRSDTKGTSLRATVGRCSSPQRQRHPVACAYIDEHPSIELIGPIDETGTPFRNVRYSAGDRRSVDVSLDGGRYTILLEIDGQGTVMTGLGSASIDLSTGDRDVGTVVPAEPWVPGA
jgi:hypothetical protein